MKIKLNERLNRRIPLISILIVLLIYVWLVTEALVLRSLPNQSLFPLYLPNVLPITQYPTFRPTLAPSLHPVTRYSSPSLDPAIADWKTYVSKFGGYTIKAPPQWSVEEIKDNSILNNQDIATDIALNANSDTNIGPDDPQVAFVTIDFPVTIQGPHKFDDGAERYEQGLKGLESFTRWGKAQYVNYIQVEGRIALVNKATSSLTPPPYLRASYCSGCTTKNVYIDLGNGKIMHIEGYWGSARNDFEILFDKVISTIHFLL